MIPRRAIARSPLLVGIPVAVVLTALILPSRALIDGGYPPAFSGWASTGMVVGVSIAAACSCWSTVRLRRAGWFDRPWRRDLGLVFVRSSLVNGLVIGSVLYLVAAMVAGFQGVTGAPAWSVWLPMLVLLVAWSCLGSVAARWLPAPVALVGSIATPYVATVFPAALEPLWLRHVTGYWPDCCSVTDAVHPRATFGVAMFGVGITAVSRVAVRGRPGPGRVQRAMLLILGVALLSLSVDTVSALGVVPTEPRAPGALGCDGRPVVCLWPEHEARRPVVEDAAEHASRLLTAASLDAPSRLSERAGGGAAVIVVDEGDTVESLHTEIVRARVVRDVASCASRSGSAVVAYQELERLADAIATGTSQSVDRAAFDGLVADASRCGAP